MIVTFRFVMDLVTACAVGLVIGREIRERLDAWTAPLPPAPSQCTCPSCSAWRAKFGGDR